MMIVASTTVRPASTSTGMRLERPECRELGVGLGIARREHAEVEGGVVLVERDQHLLAVGRKGVRVELQ